MSERIDSVIVYTDGSCLINPGGPGGWAALVLFVTDGEIVQDRMISGGVLSTTNNRMEMVAAIEGLKAVDTAIPIKMIVDSEYVRLGITTWIRGWKRRGWKTSSGSPVKNQDLWLELNRLVLGRSVEWEWVKGHSDDPFNTRVDLQAGVEARCISMRTENTE